MTRLDLRRRDPELRELMDDPDCDPDLLRRTYRQFRLVNRTLAGWGRVYRRRIRPLLDPDRATTVLDVGCGGGDVPRALAGWAARDGRSLLVTAVDPDTRAIGYAREQPPVPGVTFRQAASADLVAEGAAFDIVLSGHVLHHLDPVSLARLLGDSTQLARRLALHLDLSRSRLGYAGYAVVSWPARQGSFVRVDGLRSIRRSYRPAELAAVAGRPWQVDRHFPGHLLLWAGAAADSRPGSRLGTSGSIGA